MLTNQDNYFGPKSVCITEVECVSVLCVMGGVHGAVWV